MTCTCGHDRDAHEMIDGICIYPGCPCAGYVAAEESVKEGRGEYTVGVDIAQEGTTDYSVKKRFRGRVHRTVVPGRG